MSCVSGSALCRGVDTTRQKIYRQRRTKHGYERKESKEQEALGRMARRQGLKGWTMYEP